MSINFNRVIIGGNLTRDPECKPVGGTLLAKFALAVNRRWKDKDGQKHEEAVFIDCEAWGRTAEVLQRYCTKGKAVMIEGRLALDRWETANKEKRQRIKVVVESLTMLGQRSGERPPDPTEPPGGMRLESTDTAAVSAGDDEPPF